MRKDNPNTKIQLSYGGLTDKDGKWNGKIRTVEANLDLPLRTRKPTVWAVWNDLFHEDVPEKFITQAFAFMALTPQHTFLVLTKRPERMAEYISASGRYDAIIEQLNRGDVWELPTRTVTRLAVSAPREDKWPLPNVWLGVTAENQAPADKRIPILLQIPAAVRWVSVEPMLGPLVLGRPYEKGNTYRPWLDCPSMQHPTRLDWVVCGGESGPGARSMHPDWVRGLRDQCQAAGVPFLFKQWGEWGDFTGKRYSGHCEDYIFTAAGEFLGGGHSKYGGGVEPGWEERGGAWMSKVGKKAASRELDGRVWDEMPAREA